MYGGGDEDITVVERRGRPVISPEYMAHHKVGLEEAVTVTEGSKHPEHRPGLERALWLIEYVRLVNSGDGVNMMAHPVMIATLNRLKIAIEAELENGGPLTSDLMGHERRR